MKRRHLARTLAAAPLLLAALASNAFAQNAAPATAPAAAPSAPAAPAAPAAGSPGETSNEDADSKGRLWIGFNAGGGLGTGAHLSGPAFDGAVRVGWVLNSQMGIYGNLTFLAWIGSATDLPAGAPKVDLSVIGGQLITPMFAFTPVDLFEIAAGPSLDHLAGGSTSASVNTGAGTASASVSAFSGLYFGAQVRAALHFGGRNQETRRRRGFTLSLDGHPSFVPNGPVTFVTLGLGADWF